MGQFERETPRMSHQGDVFTRPSPLELERRMARQEEVREGTQELGGQRMGFAVKADGFKVQLLCIQGVLGPVT